MLFLNYPNTLTIYFTRLSDDTSKTEIIMLETITIIITASVANRMSFIAGQETFLASLTTSFAQTKTRGLNCKSAKIKHASEQNYAGLVAQP